jgi:hypothetical protein
VEWENADADAALTVIEDEGWRAPPRESVLRWGERAGSDPVPCAAVGFTWVSVRPDRMRDTDQVVALATLTAVADQACAMALLAALPSQAEVTRIGAEALTSWAHRLYARPGYWNPLRPDLLAEQHLADTIRLPALATTAAQLTAGQPWEARVLIQLLSELTRGAPNQPTVRAALDELLAAALSRIVDLAITTGPAELADLASLALQLAPRPDRAAPSADQMPEHSVRLTAFAATVTSQQVTWYRAGASDGEPGAANRLAGSLNNLAVRLGDLGRREEALAAIQEAAAIRRELVARWPDAYQHELEQALQVAAWLEHGEDLSDAAPQ